VSAPEEGCASVKHFLITASVASIFGSASIRAVAVGAEQIEPAKRKLLQGLPVKHITVTVTPLVCAECGADEDVALRRATDQNGALTRTPLCDACVDALIAASDRT
jgi:hypothetical protein